MKGNKVEALVEVEEVGRDYVDLKVKNDVWRFVSGRDIIRRYPDDL